MMLGMCLGPLFVILCRPAGGLVRRGKLCASPSEVFQRVPKVSEVNPIDQVIAAETGEEGVAVGERLKNSTVPQVRDAMRMMDGLIDVMEEALTFAQSKEATDEQVDDVVLMFTVFLAYFEHLEQVLTQITLENVLGTLFD